MTEKTESSQKGDAYNKESIQCRGSRSWIRDRFFTDSESEIQDVKDRISTHNFFIFGVKSTGILCQLAQIFFSIPVQK
jgi:hypothetical protein